MHPARHTRSRPAARALDVGWVGDVTPGSQYGTLPGDGGQLFAGVRSQLRAPQLMIGNLEGTIGQAGTPKCAAGTPNCFAFQAPPQSARGLRAAGFDVMNVANNHAYDYGAAGQAATLDALRAAHIGHAGRPEQIDVVRRGGRKVALVGFASYTWSAPLNDPVAARALICRAARVADTVVVLFHGGAEGSDRAHVPAGREDYLGEDRGDLRAFTHAAVDAGADLVLGSGPHIVRGIEEYRGRLIAYSLGNFAGVHNLSTGGQLGLSGILRVRLGARGQLRSGQLASVHLDASGTPTPDPTGAAAQLISGLSQADFGAHGVTVSSSGRLQLPRGV